VNLIQVGPIQVMKEGEKRIKKDLKGIEVLFMVLVVHNTRERGEITENNKVFAHCIIVGLSGLDSHKPKVLQMIYVHVALSRL
jgi:hypothetical protein